MANQGERRTTAPTPVVHAVLICDYTIRDGETGKVSVIGIFDRIFAADFPAFHPGMFVYVNMSDVEGNYIVALELLRSDSMKRIGYGEHQVVYTDRLAPAELVFDLRSLLFEEPGRYEFRVHANGTHIGGKPFNVVQVKSGGGDEPVDIELKSTGPSGVDAPGQHGVTRVRTALKIRFARFMNRDLAEDCIDLLIAKEALADPANRRIPWEQVKKELGL